MFITIRIRSLLAKKFNVPAKNVLIENPASRTKHVEIRNKTAQKL